jgi:hypothetical protein
MKARLTFVAVVVGMLLLTLLLADGSVWPPT